MGIVIRGMSNVLRNPVRLILVVGLLGASLMFVAATITLHDNTQQQLANVHTQLGTGININYPPFASSLRSQHTSQFGHAKLANTQQWHSASQADLTKK